MATYRDSGGTVFSTAAAAARSSAGRAADAAPARSSSGGGSSGRGSSYSPPPPPTPAPSPTGPSIGSYKGQSITNGTQEQIQAQIKAIDAGSGTTASVIPPSAQPTGPSIGSYKGQSITNGTQEQIQAQIKAIDAANQPIISGSNTRSDTTTNPSGTQVPPGTGIDTKTANSGLNALTPEQLSILYPQLKPGTPAYQTAMDKISSAYFDVMQQQMNASTEQEQQAAQYNWNQLKAYTEKNLNIKLADNALQAWDQIQGLNNQFNQQNTQGSGLQQEAVDNYLNRIRRTDSINRTATQTDADSKQQDYYRKFATPEQIKALVASDPQKAAGWGLVPSVEMKQAMNPAILKQKYPDMSDTQVQAYIATVLDENGNYRSALYQKYMTGANVGTNNPNISTTRDADGNPISVDVTPSDFGKTDIDRAREQNKQEQIQLQNLQMEQAKRKALGSDPKTENNYFDSPPATTGTAAASAAAANLGTNPPSSNSSSTTTTPYQPTTPSPSYNTVLTPDDPSNAFNTQTGVANPKYVVGAKPANDPSNKFNTQTGALNPNYRGY